MNENEIKAQGLDEFVQANFEGHMDFSNAAVVSGYKIAINRARSYAANLRASPEVAGQEKGEPNEHDAGILADLRAMAADPHNGFWPAALATGALRMILRNNPGMQPTEKGGEHGPDEVGIVEPGAAHPAQHATPEDGSGATDEAFSEGHLQRDFDALAARFTKITAERDTALAERDAALAEVGEVKEWVARWTEESVKGDPWFYAAKEIKELLK